MADFGRQLKEAREQRGVSLRQIATTTKISMAALEALERNDFSRLPGGIFSRAFVRAYAIQVGLDPEQTVQEFLVEYEQNDNAAAEKDPPEVTADDRAFLERQRRAGLWLRAGTVILLLGLVGALIAWQVSSHAKPAAADQPANRGSRQGASAAPGAVVEPPPNTPTPAALRDGACDARDPCNVSAMSEESLPTCPPLVRFAGPFRAHL
jgi:cytoskeleton protein RodZ